MIDTHSHIYLEEFAGEEDAVVSRAKDAGVSHIILPNVDFEDFERMHTLHSKYPEYTSMAMGLHPTSVTKDYHRDIERTLEEIYSHCGEYVAVGEIGMDLYWDEQFKTYQEEVLKAQLTAANECSLPVIIHCRKALAEMLKVIDTTAVHYTPMVMHSFTGTVDEVRQIRRRSDKCEFYFGINGICTFKKANLENTILEIGLEYILTETDSPYLAPVPNRGKRNESAYVRFVLNKLSEIFSKSVEEMDAITTANAKRLFGLK